MKKIYYRLIMKQRSPLRIGGGGNEETDNDLLLDGRGYPFIPGSAIAGILREMLPDDGSRERLMGEITPEKNSNSSVLVGDAVPSLRNKNDVEISVRDGVGLDEWGMAIKGAKYDFQIAVTDREYVSVIEFDPKDEEDEKQFENILQKAVRNGLRFGARTSRGYGEMDVCVTRKDFNFPEDVEAWLGFSPYAENAAEQFTIEVKPYEGTDSFTHLEIGFAVVGSLVIRVNEANVEALPDGTDPDHVTLKKNYTNSQDEFQSIPVIPGTAWAGAFRHHMIAINRKKEEEIDKIFGKYPDNEHKKSLLYFSETEIKDGQEMTVMRNALDRFTAGTANTALFTSSVWQGGKGILKISFDRKRLTPNYRQLLMAAIIDLDLGLLTVGGDVAVGRGVVRIESFKVDSTDQTERLKSLDVNVLEGE